MRASASSICCCSRRQSFTSNVIHNFQERPFSRLRADMICHFRAQSCWFLAGDNQSLYFCTWTVPVHKAQALKNITDFARKVVAKPTSTTLYFL